MAFSVLPNSVKPAKVRGLVVSQLHSDSAALTWVSPLGDSMPTAVSTLLPVKQYAVSVLELDNDNEPMTIVDNELVAVQSFTVGNLKPSFTYAFSVYAINDAGAGDVSLVYGTVQCHTFRYV